MIKKKKEEFSDKNKKVKGYYSLRKVTVDKGKIVRGSVYTQEAWQKLAAWKGVL